MLDKMTVQGTLAIFVAVSFVVLVAIWLLLPPTGDQTFTSLLNALVMVVGTAFLTIINFYYGSSSGSRAKDEAQSTLVDKMTSHLGVNGTAPTPTLAPGQDAQDALRNRPTS